MYKRIYRHWYLVPLLLLVLVARDWVEDPALESVEETIDMTNTQADYYLEEFITHKLNASGVPEYTINGESLIHYPATDVSEIVWPNLTLHRGDAVWNVVSKKGQLITNPDIFTLQGAVTMQRAATEELAPIVIQTSDLRVHTVDNFVETDQQIQLTSPSWTLKSKGFESKIDSGTLTLLSEVEVHYEIADRDTP